MKLFFITATTILLLLFTKNSFAAENAFWKGISVSSYQTEDPAILPSDPNFFQTDWDLFYAAGNLKEPRANGVYSYSFLDRDIAALKKLGVTHYRFGIEWARIEPKPGLYNKHAMNHYIDLIQKLKKNGITPIVCLWHFTFPSWGVSSNKNENGWLNSNIQNRWAPYVTYVAENLKKEIILFAPENEPNSQALAAYFLGSFPPGEKYNLSLYRKQISAAAEAFIEASSLIKKIIPEAKIISIQNIVYWTRAWWDIFGYFYSIAQEFNYAHLDVIKNSIDYVGLNYYYQHEATPLPSSLVINPHGLELLLADFSKRYQKPLVVMENGISSDDDSKRIEFIQSHMEAIKKAQAKGIDIRGYFFWSLVDNYEWASGYTEKFGLYSYSTDHKSITAKPSATVFKKLLNDWK